MIGPVYHVPTGKAPGEAHLYSDCPRIARRVHHYSTRHTRRKICAVCHQKHILSLDVNALYLILEFQEEMRVYARERDLPVTKQVLYFLGVLAGSIAKEAMSSEPM